MSKLLLALLAGALLGAAALAYALSSGHGEGDVRVAVQRLEDGRTEVAVQVRQSDGAWGGPQRPERRFVPADLEPGRWLYSSPVAAAAGAEAFKLGMLSIRSGPFAELGRLTEHGVELAVAHVNAAGGVWGRPVELAIEDTGHDADAAVGHARHLVSEHGVHAIVGPLTSTGVIAVGGTVAPELGVPVVSPSASAPEIADLDDHDYVFRTIISDAAQADVLAQLAEDEGYDRVAVVYRDDLWGRSLNDHFTSHYHGESASVALDPDKDEYFAEVVAAAAHGARVLVLLTVPHETVPVLAASASLGAFDTYLFEHSNKRIDIYERLPEELEGAEGVAYIGRHVTEAEGHWEADYHAMFGAEEPFSPWAREAYDAAVALMLAAERAGSSDGTRIRNAMREIADPPGERFPASSDGIAAALAAIRAGSDIDLDGEATALDWGPDGDLLSGHMEYWQFRDGEIVTIRDFEIEFEHAGEPRE